MSTYAKYDPALFAVERATQVTAKLGEMLLGVATLGASTEAWLPVESASVTVSGGYEPDEHGTLIVAAQTATVDISTWTDPGDPLVPADVIRVVYDSAELFRGTVESTSLTVEADPDGRSAERRRYSFSATATDSNWIAMQRTVSWEGPLPESSVERARLFVTVDGWAGQYG